MLALLLGAVLCRPLLPVDETRYMSAAWEMYLRGDWLAPLTVNFQPYHHKPPLLFWLINASWSLFGINRWAGTIPVVLMSMACIYLTKHLGRQLFPDNTQMQARLPLLMIGSIPFLMYGTLIMFDWTLTAFVLTALIGLLTYDRRGGWRSLVLMALAMGLGVLTKGPVAWLFLVFPMALAPLWRQGTGPLRRWYGGCLLALILSIIPVLIWLIPVLQASSHQFAFWLLWEQTAGRITGDFKDAHLRPIYFYLPLVPILFMPWLFFPSLWRGVGRFKKELCHNKSPIFLLCWIVPPILAFSLIKGKQPHYLIPLVPGILIMIAFLMETPVRRIAVASFCLIAALLTGQALVSNTLLKNYDLQPVADYLQAHPNKDIAFVRRYQGELVFLGRMTQSLDSQEFETIDGWFQTHPNGLAVIRYKDPQRVAAYTRLFDMPYRGKRMGIFSLSPPPEASPNF